MIKKRFLAFTLMFLLLAGNPGLIAGKACGLENSNAAEAGLFKALDYYKNEQKGELSCWEELLAIYGIGKIGAIDLREWRLPPVPKADKTVKSYVPSIITSLIRGMDVSSLAEELLTKVCSGKFSEYADAQAFAMLGLAVAGEEYKDKNHGIYLISLQDESGGFTGEYDGGCITNDTTGIAALALAPYANEPEFEGSVEAIVEFFEKEQLEGGGFNYYYAASQWGPSGSYESANSAALAVWGLAAIKGQVEDGDLKARIDSMLVKALPSLLKWQNEDGSFGFDPQGKGSFDSLTGRQVMIALCMIAIDDNLFNHIRLNKSVLLDSHVRIESDDHYPVDVYISSEKNEPVSSSIETAWRKAGFAGDYELDSYIYHLNGYEISLCAEVEESDNEIIAVSKVATKRSVFDEAVLVGEMNETQTVLLKDKETGLPLPGVIITINGEPAGYDPNTWQPLCTGDDGRLVIPADNFLAAGTYLISTSSKGISRDLCTIFINKGEKSNKRVSVRIEGADKNVLDEKQVLIETSGDKVLTAYDAVVKALKTNGISYEIPGGYIYMIDGISDHYFDLQGDDYDFWNFYVNGRPSALGIDCHAIDDGDELLLFYGNRNTMPSDIDWTYLRQEKTLTITITGFHYDFTSGNEIVTPIGGAKITVFGKGVGPTTAISNGQGIASFQGIEAGSYNVWAEKHDTSASKEGLYMPQIVGPAPGYTIQIPHHINVEENAKVIDLSAVSADDPQSISVTGGISAYIKINTDANTELPYINSKNMIEGTGLLIEKGTKILLSGENWDGNITLPVLTSASLPGKSVFKAVHTGCNDRDIVFDRPVRLVIPAASEKKIGFTDSSGVFTEITKTLTSDVGNIVNNQLADEAAGKYPRGGDMIVWTRHLSTFIAYTDSGGGQAKQDKVSLRVIGYNGKTSYDMLKTTQIEISGKDTPYSILMKAGLTIGGSHNYVASINGLGETDYGPQSGWKYSVNGEYPSLSADSYVLKDKDYVVWRFVTDAEDSRQETALSEDTGHEIVHFRDVDSSFWFASSVNHLASLGIISGKAEGLFMPDDKMTRAELAVILSRMAKADTKKYGEDPFSDVSDKDWFGEAAVWAKETGIFAGSKNKDGSSAFNPHANITREDLAAVIYRYASKVENKVIAGKEMTYEFTDKAQIATYASSAVFALQGGGIISGVKNKDGSLSFLPKNDATRAEAARVISAFLSNTK